VQHAPFEPLPPYIVDELSNLPRHADRKTLADIITRLLFPVSDRSLEIWPLKWRRVNGHSLASTEEGLRLAWEKFRAAPVLRGGRRYAPVDDDRDTAA
jgi:hypothetical protein